MVRAILDGRKTQTRRVVKPQPVRRKDGAYDCTTKPKSGYSNEGSMQSMLPIYCPYGYPWKEWKRADSFQGNDRLWVRETFVIESTIEYSSDVYAPTDRPFKTIENVEDGKYLLIPHYRATEPEPNIVPSDREDGFDDHTSWQPSIHMPRWAARLFLEITNIRVERLNDISEEDCQAEGIQWLWNGNCKECYQWSVTGNRKSNNWFDYAEDCYEHLWNSIHKKENTWKDNPWVWVIEFKGVN